MEKIRRRPKWDVRVVRDRKVSSFPLCDIPLQHKSPPGWRASNLPKFWRRGSGSNRRIKVLQTYRAG